MSYSSLPTKLLHLIIALFLIQAGALAYTLNAIYTKKFDPLSGILLASFISYTLFLTLTLKLLGLAILTISLLPGLITIHYFGTAMYQST